MNRKHFINIERIIQPSKTPLPLLRGEALNVLNSMDNAFISVENQRIIAIGEMQDFKYPDEITTDLSGKWVFPTWCDSHTHLVFAKYRSSEFEMRLEGKTYHEIAASGGGILNSARKLRAASEDQLVDEAIERLGKVIMKGTGALEVKSGYGLSIEGELKMLRVIKTLKAHSPIPIKVSFLGAHALPEAYSGQKEKYIDLICEELMPQVAKENLADYCDIFCETGYFDAQDTAKVLAAGLNHGLPGKIHTNQFTSIGGIQAAIKYNAKSVDHLEIMEEQDFASLSASNTIATILPIAPFFLNDPYPEGRRMVDNNILLALASDFNPGSAPSHDMALACSLACIKCGLTPTEAINAATVNGAHALDLENEVGSITPGLRANFFTTDTLESIAEIPYRICSELIDKVIINGEVFDGIKK
jgi:imidazolonepropionase